MTTPKTKKSVLFLADGSGSFATGLQGKPSHLSYTLDTITDLIRSIRETPEKSGVDYVELGIFGERQPEYKGAMLASTMHPAIMSGAADKLRHGMNSGTDLAPGVKLIREMAKNAPRGSRQHVVLVTDGDLFDKNDSVKAFTKLMNQRPGMTLGIVVAKPHDRTTEMEKFAQEMQHFGDRIYVTACHPDRIGMAVIAAALENPRDAEDSALRADIGKLRTHFMAALDQLDEIEARLDARNDNAPATPKQKPASRKKRHGMG